MDLLKEEAPCVTRAVRYMRGHFKIITFMGEAASVSQTAQLMREIFSRESARETEGMSLPAEPFMRGSFGMESPAAAESICFPMETGMKEKYKTGSFTAGDV